MGCSCAPSPALTIEARVAGRDEVRCPRRGVAQDDGVGPQRLEVAQRVEQRLALRDARGLQRDVDDVGAESLARDLERGPCSRRRLEEDVDHRASVKDARVLHVVAGRRDHLSGAVEHVENVLARELGDAEEVPVRPIHQFR